MKYSAKLLSTFLLILVSCSFYAWSIDQNDLYAVSMENTKIRAQELSQDDFAKEFIPTAKLTINPAESISPRWAEVPGKNEFGGKTYNTMRRGFVGVLQLSYDDKGNLRKRFMRVENDARFNQVNNNEETLILDEKHNKVFYDTTIPSPDGKRLTRTIDWYNAQGKLSSREMQAWSVDDPAQKYLQYQIFDENERIAAIQTNANMNYALYLTKAISGIKDETKEFTNSIQSNEWKFDSKGNPLIQVCRFDPSKNSMGLYRYVEEYTAGKDRKNNSTIHAFYEPAYAKDGSTARYRSWVTSGGTVKMLQSLETVPENLPAGVYGSILVKVDIKDMPVSVLFGDALIGSAPGYVQIPLTKEYYYQGFVKAPKDVLELTLRSSGFFDTKLNIPSSPFIQTAAGRRGQLDNRERLLKIIVEGPSSDAKILINGKEEGTGTVTKTWNEPVKVTIEITKNGKKIADAVTLDSAGILEKKYQFDAEKRTVHITSEPSGRRVSINGNESGTTPLEYSAVGISEFKISFAGDDKYLLAQETVSVNPNEKKDVHVSMKRRPIEYISFSPDSIDENRSEWGLGSSFNEALGAAFCIQVQGEIPLEDMPVSFLLGASMNFGGQNDNINDFLYYDLSARVGIRLNMWLYDEKFSVFADIGYTLGFAAASGSLSSGDGYFFDGTTGSDVSTYGLIDGFFFGGGIRMHMWPGGSGLFVRYEYVPAISSQSNSHNQILAGLAVAL